MNKKSVSEKEIEKARVERQWKSVKTLIQSFNVKSTAGLLTKEEVDLFRLFHLGEVELEDFIDHHFFPFKKKILKEELEQAKIYLDQVINEGEKVKSKLPQLIIDSHLLIAKYHYVIGEYQFCIDSLNHVQSTSIDKLSSRSKHLYAEAMVCQALSSEKLFSIGSHDNLIAMYENAGQISLAVLLDDEYKSSPASCLMKYGVLKFPHFLLVEGFAERAMIVFRNLLKVVEVKSTIQIRKVVCRRLVEVLLAFISPTAYFSPQKETIESSTDITHGQLKDNAVSLYTPPTQTTECLLAILLYQNMINQASLIREDTSKIISEIKIMFNLLSLTLLNHNEYNFLLQTMEKSMKLSYGEYQILFQFSVALMLSQRYLQAFLMLEQCHQIQPANEKTLLLCIKLCINHLQKYKEGVAYAEKLFNVAQTDLIKASALLAVGVCNHHLALKASSTSEHQKYLKLSIEALSRGHLLDPKDTEILFHLALNQALSKQHSTAVNTIKMALKINCMDYLSLHLFVLLLTAEKKYEEALNILETAIAEYPLELSLLITKVKVIQKVHSSQAALVVCQHMLGVWNDLYHNEDEGDFTVIDCSVDLPKSPSTKTEKFGFNKKAALPETLSIREADDLESIATSTQYETTVSDAASGMYSVVAGFESSGAAALLCKLWLITAECFIEIGDSTQASGCLLEAHSKFPLSPDVLYMRGRLSELLGNNQQSRINYESALAVQPEHKSAAQRLGMMYFDEGELCLAEKTLRRCVQKDTTNHTAWNDLGTVLESCGQYNEAASCYVISLQLESTSPIIQYTSLPRFFKI
ncbi:tetratricopeptide repeat protein 7B isoform X1 [Hydra vulgaris]|nr:tetratricopeptide repeat protein 7B isoform X1 [Hydra vulgaris]